MTNPFAPLSSGGDWLKPAERNGHLLIVSNAVFVTRRYDDLRKQDVDVIKFDLADLNAPGEGWLTGVQSNHPGIVNKLAGILGNPEGKVLGRIGQVASKSGHPAWVLADAAAEDVTAAVAWLNANPAPLVANPFAVSAPVVTAPAPVGLPPVAAPAPAAVAAAPTQAQGDVNRLLAQLQAQQV